MPLPILTRLLRFIQSLNDPRWGNEPNQQENNPNKKPGVNDLDELWRDFNQRLNKLFGGKNNKNNGAPMSNQNKQKKSFGIGAIVLTLIVVWLASGFFIVQEGQTAVISTFGRYSHTTVAGFNWCWPYPIQAREIVNMSQMRMIEVGYRKTAKNKIPQEALMLSGDENIVDIQFAVQYRLKNAADWVFNNRDQEQVVKQVAETAVREIVGKEKMDFVLYEGREKVAADTMQLMQKILDRYRTGVQLVNVTMQNVQPPEQVQATFDEALKAGQDRVRQQNEGQAYANDVIPKARGSAARLLQEAEAYRARVIADAEGNAGRFRQIVGEYQKAPAVTRDRLYLETMQQIFANTTKVIADTKNGNSLLYLPFDKLLAKSISETAVLKSNTAPTSNGTATPASSSAQAANESITDTVNISDKSYELRARDARDLREREVR